MRKFDRAGTIDESVAVAEIIDDLSRTEPWRDSAPARTRMLSSRVVLPLWKGPTTAMSLGPSILLFSGMAVSFQQAQVIGVVRIVSPPCALRKHLKTRHLA
jgi:hypothetical protein